MTRSIFVAMTAIVLFSMPRWAGASPYKGVAQPVPGRIEACNYDDGGQGVGYSVVGAHGSSNWYRQDGVDLEDCADYGGYDLGWAQAGNWFRYTVNVGTAGKYTVGFRLAAGNRGGRLHLEDHSGRDLTGSIVVPSTGGWQVWTTVYAILSLPAGEQTLTLVDDTAGYNIHYMSLGKGYPVPPAPTGLAVSSGNGQATLMWTASDGAQAYDVYCGRSADGESSVPIARGIASPNYACSGLQNGVTYYFKVAAEALGKSSPLSNEVSVLSKDSNSPNFGPNVLVFEPDMPMPTIQSQLDFIFERQQANQFGSNRYDLLFKPGAYKATVKVGYYTQVAGLGLSPDDTAIDGAVQTDAAWFNGNATQNFWREAENLSVTPEHGPSKWAVSQACPFRRIHVRGDMVLDDHGWSSGGFMADCVVDGQVNSGSQQQWLTRNSICGSWKGSNWNTVFVGVGNAPAADTFPHPTYTVVDKSPVVREKPFLVLDGIGKYGVFVPSISTDSTGTSWAGKTPQGKLIPISRFYIAHPSDTSKTIDAALGRGLNLLLTPGTYSLDGPITVTKPNAVVLGLGLATLKPINGTDAMDVADVDGVIIAGILFDAGSINSAVLLKIGDKGSGADHAANPVSLDDIFFRVGGADVGKAAVSLQVNSNNVIGDDLWIWRADHSYGVGWDVNTAANGIVVNGRDVTMYGLAVEHYQEYQTLWNGNGGRVYFYQSEEPYDVPGNTGWTSGTGNGYPSYKVADTVTSHHAWGLGVYCAFTHHDVAVDSSIQSPKAPDISFVDMTTVSLGGAGVISHLINDMGNSAQHGTTVQTLRQYP